MRNKRAQNLMWSLGYTNSLGVISEGQSGGLVLFWRQPHIITLQGCNSNCIDMLITPEMGVQWRATFVYGDPRREKRHEFWALLHKLSTQWTGPRICSSDFNEALCQDEHFGSSNRLEAQMRLFKECLDDCGLSNLGYSGPKFTWTNKQEMDSNIRVRLDRVVANGAFTQLFDDCCVENVITTMSDHYALAISIGRFDQPEVKRPVQVGFKYEAAWLRSPD
jgi:hypothetical protein